MKKDYNKSPNYIEIIQNFAAQSAAKKKRLWKKTIMTCIVKKDYKNRLSLEVPPPLQGHLTAP